MHLETLASHEGLLQPPHDLGFIIRQLVRVLRINRGKAGIEQSICAAFIRIGTVLKVDSVQDRPVLHPEAWPSFGQLTLQFELDDRNCFMYFRHQGVFISGIFLGAFEPEDRAGIITVCFEREGRQRQ